MKTEITVPVFKLALCHSNFSSQHLITLFQLTTNKDPQNSEQNLWLHHNHNLQWPKIEQIWQSVMLYSSVRLTAFEPLHFLSYEVYNTTALTTKESRNWTLPWDFVCLCQVPNKFDTSHLTVNILLHVIFKNLV